jgi:WD40 repeat protein
MILAMTPAPERDQPSAAPVPGEKPTSSPGRGASLAVKLAAGLRASPQFAVGLVTGVALVSVLLLVMTIFSPSQKKQGPSPGSPSASLSGTPGAALSGTPAGILSDPDGYDIRDVAFSPDGKTIAGSAERFSLSAGHVDLWNSASRQPEGILTDTAGGNDVGGLAFSPKSANTLAVADLNGIDLWNLAARNGTDLWNLAARSAHVYADPDNGWIDDAGYAPDGKSVAEFNEHGHVYLLDVVNGRWSARSYTDPAVGPSTLAAQVEVSPNGKTLAAADSAGNVYLWNRSGGSPLVIKGASQSSSIQTVAFSPDGNTLAIAGQGDVQLWDVATRTLSARLTGTGTSPQAIVFSPNGKTLTAGDANGSIYLWDLASRQEAHISSAIMSWGGLEFSPDGRTLAAFSCTDAKIYLYSITYAAS